MSDSANVVDRFLHITDLHFWEVVINPLRLLNKRFIGNINVCLKRRSAFPMDRARDYAKYAASLGIQDAIITGDFASTSTERELGLGANFLRGLDQHGMTPRAIAGNHDVYTFESVRKRRCENHFDDWLPGKALPCIGSLPGGTPVLYVPTVCPNWISSKGRIKERDVECVSDIIADLPSPLVVAGHYPILQKTSGYTVNRNRRLHNAKALQTVLGESGKTILYICGHVHRFSYDTDPLFPNLKHLTTGAFFRTARESDTQGEFSEVHISQEGFDVKRHTTQNGRWTVNLEQPK